MITVVGSANMDLIATVSHLPAPGETVLASSLLEAAGGKGANQAVAAARAGATVTFVGRVGSDPAGEALRQSLDDSAVSTDFLHVDAAGHTGLALIGVDQNGQNSIIVASGVNGNLSPGDVDAAAEMIRASTAVVLQLEVPLDTVARAAHVGRDGGTSVVLNAAPARPLDRALLRLVDILIVNEEELSMLSGVGPGVGPAASATMVRDLGAGTVIVTLGDRGSLIVTKDGEIDIPAFATDIVDSTGAGDTFTGNLTAALDRGDTLETAARWASAAAALSVSRPGAQPAMPTAEETRGLLERTRG